MLYRDYLALHETQELIPTTNIDTQRKDMK